MNTVEIPTTLPYPKILPLDAVPELRDNMCFVIEPYPMDGVAFTIVRSGGDVCMQVTDFHGNLLSPKAEGYGDCIRMLLETQIPKILLTMKSAHIPKTTYYFSNVQSPILVDVRVSLNKMTSPGFVADIFGKQKIPIQRIIGKPLQLTTENIEMLKAANGDYAGGQFILKTLVFKSIIRDGKILPLYGVLDNEIKNAT